MDEYVKFWLENTVKITKVLGTFLFFSLLSASLDGKGCRETVKAETKRVDVMKPRAQRAAARTEP